jgi:hypothetical protein
MDFEWHCAAGLALRCLKRRRRIGTQDRLQFRLPRLSRQGWRLSGKPRGGAPKAEPADIAAAKKKMDGIEKAQLNRRGRNDTHERFPHNNPRPGVTRTGISPRDAAGSDRTLLSGGVENRQGRLALSRAAADRDRATAERGIMRNANRCSGVRPPSDATAGPSHHTRQAGQFAGSGRKLSSQLHQCDSRLPGNWHARYIRRANL